MSYMDDNSMMLTRSVESKVAATTLRLLLRPDLPFENVRRRVLSHWRSADEPGRLLRFEIDQLFMHISRIQLAASAAIVNQSDVAAVAIQGIRLLGNREIQDYLRSSQRLEVSARLTSLVQHLAESAFDPDPPRGTRFPTELCIAIISFDLVLRSTRIRALTARVEEIALDHPSVHESRIERLGESIAGQYKDSIEQHPKRIVERSRRAECVLAVFDLLPVLGELERLLEASEKARQRERFLDHYSYLIKFLGPHLYPLLIRAVNSLSRDEHLIAALMGLSPEEVHNTCRRIERLAERTLLAARARTSPQEPMST